MSSITNSPDHSSQEDDDENHQITFSESRHVDLIGYEDSTDKDGDIGVLVSLGDEIFSEGKKSRESNIGDSDNIRNGGKTAGRAIITWSGGITSLLSKSEGTIVE
ncbi:hypothetical protein Tco_0458644 [Tanacetum coccineum]